MLSFVEFANVVYFPCYRYPDIRSTLMIGKLFRVPCVVELRADYESESEDEEELEFDDRDISMESFDLFIGSSNFTSSPANHRR